MRVGSYCEICRVVGSKTSYLIQRIGAYSLAPARASRSVCLRVRSVIVRWDSYYDFGWITTHRVAAAYVLVPEFSSYVWFDDDSSRLKIASCFVLRSEEQFFHQNAGNNRLHIVFSGFDSGLWSYDRYSIHYILQIQITIKSLDTVTRHIQLFQAAAIYSVHVPKYQQTCWYSRINKHVDILTCLCKFVTIANHCICRAVQIIHAIALDRTFVEQKSKPTVYNHNNVPGNI